ncbi:MAG: LacI family DNA-binding transcriptional regulator [Clostridia bacterium]|nr:LacI family DNA-binding transcriptional regulator [Clostridia bacterium]
MTLSKLASIAHVSVSTVSKAFSMSPEVSEETRELIFDIAKEHGCFKKYYNAKYSRYVIAVICPEFRSRHYSRYTSLLQKELSKYNCEICVTATDFLRKNKKNVVEYYDKYTRVDGMIIIDQTADLVLTDELPVVIMGAKTMSNKGAFVVRDSNAAIRQAIDHFINNGVKDIAFISEKHTASKRDFFVRTMNKLVGGTDEDFVVTVDERFEQGGYLAMETILNSGKVPRAVICGYDNMAIGAIRCILDRGLRVPQDVAVVGMDDNTESRYLNPPLASINPHVKEMCALAVDSLMKLIKGEPVERRRVVKAELVLRESAEV